MPTVSYAELMARRLCAGLADGGSAMAEDEARELIAAQLGHPNWAVATTRLDPEPEAVAFKRAVPVLRIFDVQEARNFYCDFLGFKVDFEHRFKAGAPLYMGVSRALMPLHLTEHDGDAGPGSTAYVPTTGVRALHDELHAKTRAYAKPEIESLPWAEVLTVQDPFGNRIRFAEEREPSGGAR